MAESVKTPVSPTDEYYRGIFDKVDRDKNGTIDVHELQEMLNRSDSYDELSNDTVQRIYTYADEDGDGRLNYREFVGMINNPKLRRFFGKYVDRYVNFVIPKKKARQSNDDIDNVYEEEYSCCPPALGMIIISIIEVAFFLIDELNEENSTKFASGPMAKIFIYDPKKKNELWRYFTYMFVHIGHLHLVVNLVVQIAIGIPLEMVHGWWRILMIYVTGVIAGSLATAITDPMSKLAGASGGVYSLITAHIASIIMNWKEMSFPGVQLIIFTLITVMDLGTSIYNRYFKHTNEHIGYVAHFAGAVVGLLVGINVLRNLKVNRKEKFFWWIAMIIFAVLMTILILLNFFLEGNFTDIVT